MPMQTLIIQHDYPVQPARLWAIATDCAALGVAMDDLSPTHAVTGQMLHLRIPVLGLRRSHVIHIALCDDARMILRTHEQGRGGHRWRLTLAVTPSGMGSRLTERIELDAGFLNPIQSLWAREHYARRHAARLRLLEAEDGLSR